MKPIAISYIRFSSMEQEQGDSHRRQIALAEEYAKEHNLVLDNTITDKGLSAFTGEHRIKGSLGRFLDFVEQGKIPKGSVLIVENLDRLSREQVLDALSQFVSIIKAGIKIVTLQDRMEYTMESIDNNFTQLIISISIMARAHEESSMKSKRLIAAWENKRAKIKDGIKLTSRCPAWLEPEYSEPDSNGKKDIIGYTPIEEAVRVIKSIFEMYFDDSFGKDRIVRELNDSICWRPPARRNKRTGEMRTSAWRESYISKLLHDDRRLIGEYKPRHKIDGKYEETGEIITNYYPVIIDKNKYNSVQVIVRDRAEKAGNLGGRNDKLNNLFSPMAICVNCGSPMYNYNAGKKYGGQYFRCRDSKNGLNCEAYGINYNLVEDTILSYCLGLKVSDLLVSSKIKISQISKLEKLRQNKENKISAVKNKIKSIEDKSDLSTTESYSKMLEKRWLLLDAELKRHLEELAPIIESLTQLENIDKESEVQLKDVQELIDKMSKMTGEKRVEFRLRLRGQLRRLIRQIKISDEVAILFFKSGVYRIIRYDDSQEYLKYMDKAPEKDVELAKAGKLPDEVGPGMYRTKYYKKKSE